MRKLLWVGDAACPSGFAKCTHYTLDVLRRTWDVVVLGLNYRGDPHQYPYPIFPCWPGGDLFGVGRLEEMIDTHRPDLVVIQNDPWNIPSYMAKVNRFRTPPPVVGTIAVDGKNVKGTALNGLARALFWTKFARDEAAKGGMTVPSGIVPLGVDLNVYKPGPRDLARKRMGFSGDVLEGFIVGNVNRNQPRKHLDLTIKYFAEWVTSFGVDDAFLYLHVAPTGEKSVDCQQLAQYYGIADRVLVAEPAVFVGASEYWMQQTYCAFDVQVSTTQGEGWGLTTLEGMACGVPQIVPDWSALGEWAQDAAVLIPCSHTCVTPKGINTIGGLPDEDLFVDALNVLYRNPKVYQECVERGLELAARDVYRWENIGEAFARELEEVYRGPHVYA